MLNFVTLKSGGGDLACDHCLAECLLEHATNVLGVVADRAAGEECAFCGRSSEQSKAVVK